MFGVMFAPFIQSTHNQYVYFFHFDFNELAHLKYIVEGK